MISHSGQKLINLTVANPESELESESEATHAQNSTVWPEFTHFYEIRSTGPSDILGVDVLILFPSKTLQGHQLSRLTSQPTVTEGQASCDPLLLKDTLNNHNNNQSQENGEAPEMPLSTPPTLSQSPDATNTVIRCRTERITRNDRVVIRLSARLSSEAIIMVFIPNEFIKNFKIYN